MAEQERRVLITGGSGFLGRAIVRTLLQSHPQWRISILDIRSPSTEVQERLEHFFLVDITSAEAVSAVFEEYHPDIVVHSAGVVPERQSRYSTKAQDWERCRAINYDGTRNMLQSVMSAGGTRFLYTSSVTAIVDDLDHDYHHMDEEVPTGLATLHYGRSKALTEAYVLSPEHAEKGLKACALRPCIILGPEDTQVIAVIHDLIAKGETNFIIGDGNNMYDWMYIDNAVHAHILAIENLLTSGTAAGHAIFITNHEPTYFWDLLAYVWAQFGHVPRYKVYIPASLALIVGIILEWITWLTQTPATLDAGSVKDGIRTRYCNNSKSIQILGYYPKVGLAEGVRRSCDGYKKQLAARKALAKSSNSSD